MVTQIGIVAGEIWNFLDEHGETTLEKITKGIDKSEKLILMSLGWLAREKHIVVTEKDNTYHINLNQKKQKIK
ncbi:MAG: winged helix-turn-helix domain-containing protein [Candidatus Omnitrophica bacterium]|nr:winged helix-turn-helix domain-containing protein [Candidatus Omnitrophota bacterium]MCF7887712.1 winged helix-turn-helix domain-containing protein [Candidatus Omnitrophota bacterium]